VVQQTINIGATANDGTGDTWRDAFDKTNDNFDELFASGLAVNMLGGYIYDGTAITDIDPGAGKFKLNSLDPTLATIIYISKTQFSGPALTNILLQKKSGDNLILLDRDVFGAGNIYTVAGSAINATGYVKIPIMHFSQADISPIIDGNYTVMSTDENGGIVENAVNIILNQQSVDRIAITEVIEPGLLSIDNPPSAGFTFSYTEGIARFIGEDSARNDVTFPGEINVAIDGGLTSEVIVLTVNTLGQVDQYDSFLTPTLRRTTALLGFVSRETTGELRAAFNPGQIEFQVLNKFFDLVGFLGPLTGSSVRTLSSGVSDTTFQINGGVSYSQDASGNINDPSTINVPSVNPMNFVVYLSTGDVEAVEYTPDTTNTEIVPGVYDGGGGVLIPITGNDAQIIRIWFQPSASPPQFRLIHGQTVYNNMTDAFNDLDNYDPIVPDTVFGAAIDCGGLIVKANGGDFTNEGTAGDVIYFKAKQAGGGAGGSGIAQNFQQVYLNSATQPQVLINATQGAVQFQDGSNVITQRLFEVLNFTDDKRFAVSGSGVNTATGMETGITGIESMTGPMVINGTTDVDVPGGNGYVVNYYDDPINGVIVPVKWEAVTIAIPNLGVDAFTIIYVDNTGAVLTSNSSLTPTQQRERIQLGETINNTTVSQVLFVINTVRAVNSVSQAFYDEADFKGPSTNGGTVAQTSNTGANGDLSLSITALNLSFPGVSWHPSKSNPNQITYAATDPTIWTEFLQDGTVVDAAVSLISGILYDDGTSTPALVPTAGAGRRTTIQYLFKALNGSVLIQLGQTVYDDLTIAAVSLDEDIKSFVVFEGLELASQPLAAIMITQNAVDIIDTQVIIQNFSSGGGSGSGSGPTTFVGLSDTPTEAGAENTAVTWDGSGNLQNTGLTHRESATCWFLQGANVPGTGSVALGFFNNNADSDTVGSVFVGQNNANTLGDGNNNINIVGRGNLNSVIPDAVLSNVFINCNTSLAALVSGISIIAMGASCGNALTAGTRVSLMGSSAGSAVTSATDMFIYGNQSGPAGAVTNYVDVHDIMHMNKTSKTVLIGGASNEKPAATQYSLKLESIAQVMGLNILNQTAEDAITLSPADFWYESTSDQVRANLTRGVVDLSGFPTGFIYWPFGPRRANSQVFRVNAPFNARDDTDTYDFRVAVNLDASLLVDGVGGIETSQFPSQADTLYHLRTLGDTTGVLDDDVDLIEAGTSPPLPTGYDKSITLWPPMLTTAGAIFVVTTFSVIGNSVRSYHLANEGNSQFLSDGPATVNTSVDLSGFVPTGARLIVHLGIRFLNGVGSSPLDKVNINIDESVTGGQNTGLGPGSVITDKASYYLDVMTSLSATIKYNQDDFNTVGTNRTDMFYNGLTSPMRF